jgi:hypothetical protein
MENAESAVISMLEAAVPSNLLPSKLIPASVVIVRPSIELIVSTPTFNEAGSILSRIGENYGSVMIPSLMTVLSLSKGFSKFEFV